MIRHPVLPDYRGLRQNKGLLTILTSRHISRPTRRLKGFPSVYGIRPTAECGTPAVAGGLGHAVYELLPHLRTSLSPGLLFGSAKILSRLNNCQIRVCEMVGQDLGKEVWTRTEVGVEY